MYITLTETVSFFIQQEKRVFTNTTIHCFIVMKAFVNRMNRRRSRTGGGGKKQFRKAFNHNKKPKINNDNSQRDNENSIIFPFYTLRKCVCDFCHWLLLLIVICTAPIAITTTTTTRKTHHICYVYRCRRYGCRYHRSPALRISCSFFATLHIMFRQTKISSWNRT